MKEENQSADAVEQPAAWAAFSPEGNIRCWSINADHRTLEALKEQGSSIHPLYTAPPAAQDVRCEGCGYMTHHREHMGCVRAAKQNHEDVSGLVEALEPVAIVGNDYSLHWVGHGPIAPIIERHSIRPGSFLYAASGVSRLVAALQVTSLVEAHGNDALDAARWRYIRQFLKLDDVGDRKFCLGLVVSRESLEEAVSPSATRLYTEWWRDQYVNCSEENLEPDESIPAPSVDDAIDAALAAHREQQGEAP